MSYIDRIVSFVLEYSTYTSREALKEQIIKHLEYHTCVVLTDDKGITAFCRWNTDAIDTAHILDLIIRKDVRGQGLLQEVVHEGLKLFPDIKYIKYEKGYDDGLQDKELMKYKVRSFYCGGEKGDSR